jgi:hypothetical protein
MSFTFGTGTVVATIFLINIPFGYWRESVRKLSVSWFLAVHLPVLIAIGLRVHEHIAFRLITLPLFVGVFFAGQFLGGKLRSRRSR